jgi:LuxR family maltose regulon positive regulatory protein
MTTLLLRTKLYTPPIRPELVSRPRLIERLNAGLRRKLTVLSAPAGFGKTTLLSEWAAGCGRPVAWVSLDRGDNDPARFWAYFIAALQTIHEDVGEAALAALQSPQRPSIKLLLASLINEIAEAPKAFALVLDDFHVITDQPVNDEVAFFLDNMPLQMHLILSSRADPPWPLARRRARGELTELRANDLRFTSQEAATFLNEVMKLDLSPEDMAALEERTEGWIVGLQMAALSMRGHKDVSEFIKAFSGTHRFILDYLVEEVLDRQFSDTQEFLLETSILERMTAPLCDAVTNRDDSQAILAQLEQANVFLIPLDDERRWYRYHHLFADLLRSRLEQTWPDRSPVLHCRASEWYEQKRLIAETVGHAFAAGDVERVARLVKGNTLAMMDHGELSTLVGWLDALPDEVVRSRPWLCVAYAWALAYAGQLDAAAPLLQDAEKASQELYAQEGDLDEESKVERRRIAGYVANIRSYGLYVRGDLSRATQLARQATEYLPESELRARGLTMGLLGVLSRWSGDLAAAARASTEAVDICLAAGDSYLAVHIVCDLAVLDIQQGQLHKAVATCRDALQIAEAYAERGGRRLPVTGHAYTLLSAVLLEWNDLEAALRYAREGITLCKLCGQADVLTTGYHSLAKALQAIGDADGALTAILEARQFASGISSWYAARAAAWETRLRLVQEDVPAATRWAHESGLSVDDEVNFQLEYEYRTLARVLIAQERLEEASGLLTRLLRVEEGAGAMGSAIEILVLQALVLDAQGEVGLALNALGRALSLAQREGYVRIFIDEGAPMGKLLREAIARGIAPEYASKLLSALEATPPHHHTPTLIEPLSERELEVLRFLTTHLSSTEIAEELFIAANTVRSHIKNIYGKLNVHSRKDAIQRAQELELL